MQQTRSEQRNQEGVDPVDPAKDASVAAANHGILREVPGDSDAGADSAVERVIGILGVVYDVADRCKANVGRIGDAGKRKLLFLLQEFLGAENVAR